MEQQAENIIKQFVPDQIQKWLHDINLPENSIQKFKEYNISGRDLLILNQSILEKRFHQSPEEAIILIDQIENLKDDIIFQLEEEQEQQQNNSNQNQNNNNNLNQQQSQQTQQQQQNNADQKVGGVEQALTNNEQLNLNEDQYETQKEMIILQKFRKNKYLLDESTKQFYIGRENQYLETQMKFEGSNLFIGKRHAVIWFDGQKKQFYISDCGSSNGTFKRIQKDQARVGDRYLLGSMIQLKILQLNINEQENIEILIATDSEIDKNKSLSSKLLRFKRDGEIKTIGRDPKCDFQINRQFTQVSKFHLQLRRHKNSIELQDFSSHGTWIRLQGEKDTLKPETLSNNDQIKLTLKDDQGEILNIYTQDKVVGVNNQEQQQQSKPKQYQNQQQSELNICNFCQNQEENQDINIFNTILEPCNHIVCFHCAYNNTNCPVQNCNQKISSMNVIDI